LGTIYIYLIWALFIAIGIKKTLKIPTKKKGVKNATVVIKTKKCPKKAKF
jgi:hypothetical protein